MRRREGPARHDLRPLRTADLPSHGPGHRWNRNADLEGMGSRGRADRVGDTRGTDRLLRHASTGADGMGSTKIRRQSGTPSFPRVPPEAAGADPPAWELVGAGRYM